MTFEKQQCEKCHRVCFCILHYQKNKGFWLCDNCYSWIIEDATIKDQMLETYKKFGMEDIEIVNL